MDIATRNKLISQKIKQFTEEMTREPGAKERCRAYLQELGKECGFWWDQQGNIHYDESV